MGEFSPIHWLIVLFIIPPLYFLPSICGQKEKERPRNLCAELLPRLDRSGMDYRPHLG